MQIFKKRKKLKEIRDARTAEQAQKSREWLKSDEHKRFEEMTNESASRLFKEPFYFLTRDEFGNVISRTPMYL